MPTDDFKTILGKMMKPLQYASGDNFAHLKSLTDMEKFMRPQLKALRRVTPRHADLDRIERLFAGFDNLTVENKRSHILEATALIEALEDLAETMESAAATSRRFGAAMARRRKYAYKPGAPAEAGHDLAALSRHRGASAGFARVARRLGAK